MGNYERNNSTCQSLSASIQEDLDALPIFSERLCIYRVPKPLREVNKEAYTPTAVSIGPLHYMDESLAAMEVHKLKYLQSFLQDCRINTNLSSCLLVVKDKETEIRNSYADPTMEISSDNFTRMVLIDSVFIIELFRRFIDPSLRLPDDRIWGKSFMIDVVKRDIILVENQLPFFILKDLYWTAFKPHEGIVPYFTDLACLSLNVNKLRIYTDRTTNEATCLHLLDLLRSYGLPSKEKVYSYTNEYGKNMLCPTAMSLYESGVKFRVVESDTSSWTDIHFDNNKGLLTIPKLQVTDYTESCLRNLIALEHCHYLHLDQTYISDYHFFLDCLINTPEDVHVLAKERIIENWLGSDKDVSDLVNSLGKHVSLTSSQYLYADITEELNNYCSKRWNRYRATLNHIYFKHPWAVISVIYAAILLILTLIQVVLAFMAVPSVFKKS